ncbi:VWA domain-containing protein [Streptomyces sp. NBRC 110035]|uniref:VWA domain-containing protein n=1 Tax=Streptomyces sp. NBRC 110035 TaxID=1547867 RepID=UPI0005A992FB|nr:VWA domain-containing protein [Streptomyces sp. NBRC 110035]
MSILTLLRNVFSRSRKANATEAEGAAPVAETDTAERSARPDAATAATPTPPEPADESTAAEASAPRLPSPSPEPTPETTTVSVPEPRSDEHDLVSAAFNKVTPPTSTSPEAEPAAEPAAEKPEAEPKAAAPSEAPQPEPEITPTTEAEAHPEASTGPDTVPTAKAEAAPEPEPKADTKPDADLETVAKPEPEPDADLETETKPEAEAEAEPEPEPDADLEAKPKAEADPEPKPKPEPDADLETETKPKAEAEAEPEPDADLETETKPKAEADPEPKPKPKPDADLEAKPKAEPEPDADLETEPEPEPKTQPEPTPEATPEPTSESVPEAAPEPEPAVADGEDTPQGPPAPGNETRTGGAGGNTTDAEGEAEAEVTPTTPEAIRTAYEAAAAALAEHNLTGTRARVYLVLDRSASMRPYYKDGSAQALAEQTLALAAHLDADPESATVKVVFFSTEVDGTGELTLADHENKIDTLHASLGRMGRTSYHAAVAEVLALHDKAAPGAPALVVFQTDGAPDAKTPATQSLTEAAKTHPSVFFSFVAFGDPENKAFDYLRKLKAPNTAHFLTGESPLELTDKELYEAVLKSWRP